MILGAFVGVFIQTLTHKNPTNNHLVNKDIPTFSLPSLNNPTTLITQDDILKDTPILLNIWASWCAPCRKEHKFISKFANDYHIKVYGLNYKDKPENAQKFLQKYGNPYSKVMNDSEGLTTLNWGIRGVPESFVINKQGKIIYRHTGEITAENFKDVLQKFNVEDINK